VLLRGDDRERTHKPRTGERRESGAHRQEHRAAGGQYREPAVLLQTEQNTGHVAQYEVCVCVWYIFIFYVCVCVCVCVYISIMYSTSIYFMFTVYYPCICKGVDVRGYICEGVNVRVYMFTQTPNNTCTRACIRQKIQQRAAAHDRDRAGADAAGGHTTAEHRLRHVSGVTVYCSCVLCVTYDCGPSPPPCEWCDCVLLVCAMCDIRLRTIASAM
jgi:hypothetical protein